jgi:hypothetical protein
MKMGKIDYDFSCAPVNHGTFSVHLFCIHPPIPILEIFYCESCKMHKFFQVSINSVEWTFTKSSYTCTGILCCEK